MTHPRQERLVRELLAEDSSLRGREAQVREVVAGLLAHDPVETASPAFLMNLREELRARALQMEQSWWERVQQWMPLIVTSSAAVTALLVLFIPGIRTSLQQEPTPLPMEMHDQENQALPYGDTRQDLFQQRTTNEDAGGVGGAANSVAPTPPSAEMDTAVPATMEMQAPMMMTAPMEKSMTSTTVILPKGLSVPTDLSSTASMHDPARGDRPITVYVPTLEMIQSTLIQEITARLPAGQHVTTIRLGNPVGATRSYAFESLPGPVSVRLWIFTDIMIDGTPWEDAKTNPVIVPLQLPTYE